MLVIEAAECDAELLAEGAAELTSVSLSHTSFSRVSLSLVSLSCGRQEAAEVQAGLLNIHVTLFCNIDCLEESEKYLLLVNILNLQPR